jgi:hypothetical protein
MTVSTAEARSRAQAFSKEWAGATDERAESQSFWGDFFRIFGLERRHFARFEKHVKHADGGNGYIDVFWPKKLLCEQKSAGRSLDAAYDQALRYLDRLPNDEVPGHVVVSDFARMKVYDHDNDELREFALEELSDNIELFDFIRLDDDALRWDQEQAEASVKACRELSTLHDLIEAAGYTGHKLEVFLVRLLFCFFAEDAGIFDSKGQFSKYVVEHSEDSGAGTGATISSIFEVLNTPDAERMMTMPGELRTLPYVNGGVFREQIPHVGFDRDMRVAFMKCGQLDWKSISPSIIGSIFQGVMHPEQRRSDGAHYTTEDNILKVIHPLFLDDLYAEFVDVKNSKPKLKRFHAKLASLTFFDPACGSGNFLTTAYKELRHLEDQVLEVLWNGQTVMDLADLVKVNVGQFYGIELLDFPCQIANVAIWLADHQANRRTGQLFGMFYRNLPLTDYGQIIHGNALTMEWADLIPQAQCSYILGNPPFVGGKLMNDQQREEVRALFGKVKLVNSIDYVSAWYYKAAEFIQGTKIRCAFVSTNSICQGQQVYPIWHTLFERFDVSIDFAYRTFEWESEASGKARVHVVIVGFSQSGAQRKRIYNGEQVAEAHNINPYLVDAPNILVDAASSPICDVPQCVYGSLVNDGGNYIFEPDELDAFLTTEPGAEKYVRRFIGSEEFINGKDRYILYLRDASPADLKSMPEVTKRIQAVRAQRANSTAAATRETADTPTQFYFDSSGPEDYLVIPSVSSERRDYIPIGLEHSDVIASNLVSIVPGATLYDFGILTSRMHNAWMRRVGGRLESRYRYTPKVVYNTFPWPDASDEQKVKIAEAAQAVLDARDVHAGCTLAVLYDPNLMPPNLVKAHKALDRMVEKAYGVDFEGDEDKMVARLFEMYATLTNAD